MQTRRLGKTDAQVPVLMFGCGMVAGLMIDKPFDTMRAVVKRALDAGMDWFDTAELYGQGRSEANLGAVLKDLGAAPRVSTKINLTDEEMDDIPAAMERHARASLDRLGRPSVELLQLHNQLEPNTGPGGGPRKLTAKQALGPGGAVEGLERLRDKGLCTWIGITALGDNGLCQEVVASGRVDTAQVYLNMINPSAGMAAPGLATGQDFAGLIACCAAHDVGVIAIRALASGLIAAPDPQRQVFLLTKDTTVAEDARRAIMLRDLLGDLYGTPVQTALRFVLADERVACADFAPGEISHLDEALAMAAAPPMTGEDVRRLRDLSQR